MNPTYSPESHPFELSKQPNHPAVPNGESQARSTNEAAMSAAREQAPAPSGPPQFQPFNPAPGAPPAGQPAQAPMPQGPPPMGHGNPMIADDTDLIEKAWVLKAKQIVARTRSDPYRQNEEMTRMKADYIKKRYNKDIKLSSDA